MYDHSDDMSFVDVMMRLSSVGCDHLDDMSFVNDKASAYEVMII